MKIHYFSWLLTFSEKKKINATQWMRHLSAPRECKSKVLDVFKKTPSPSGATVSHRYFSLSLDDYKMFIDFWKQYSLNILSSRNITTFIILIKTSSLFLIWSSQSHPIVPKRLIMGLCLPFSYFFPTYNLISLFSLVNEIHPPSRASYS